MTDSKHLYEEANRLRKRMQSYLDDANKSNLRAESLGKSGDINAAANESERANSNYKDATRIEHEAIECERKAAELEARAVEIERRAQDLQEKTQAELAYLERQKRSLRRE